MAKKSTREVKDGLQEQGAGAAISIAYEFVVPSTKNAPSSITSVVVENYNKETQAYTDVTSTVMPAGSHTISGHTMTLKQLTDLTAGNLYRVTVTYVIDGNTDDAYMWVEAKK